MWGWRLRGDAGDRAALAAIARAAPASLGAPWQRVEGEGAVVVVSAAFDAAAAAAVSAAGHDVVDVADDAALSAPAPALVLALPLVPEVAKDVVEAVFVVDSAAEAGRLCERLLLLERADARLCELDVDGVRCVVFRVDRPPVWLLLWAADEPTRGVRCFVRTAGSPAWLYTAFGARHPLPDVVAAGLERDGAVGLLSADGRLTRVRAPWPESPLVDAVRAELPTVATALAPAPLAHRFRVPIRLAPDVADDAAEPELFLLHEDALVGLAAFVESLSGDELARLFLSRLTGPDGRAVIALRELVRPGTPRLGARLQMVLGARGFVRVPALEGLFVPPGQRLMPQLRRDELRRALGVDDGVFAIVDDGPDGLVITQVARLDDQPITQLVSYVATAHRRTLERLFEHAVLTFPLLHIERPPAASTSTPAPALAPAPKKAAAPLPATRRSSTTPAPTVTLSASTSTAELAAQAQALEERVLAEPSDSGAWATLAVVKARLNDVDDAAVCAGRALCDENGDADAVDVVGVFVEGVRDVDAELVALCTKERPTPAEAMRLCGLVLRTLAAPRPDVGVLQAAEQRLLAPDLPVSRRLQWAVLRALHTRSGDAIGVTRAKEAVLGAINARGLTETFDLARFERQRLAFGEDGGRRVHARGEQLAVLERLLPMVVASPLEVSQAREALLKAIFLHGLRRLGGDVRDLATAVELEAPVHEEPVRVLLRLYLARAAHTSTAADAAAVWAFQVSQALESAERVEDRRVAEWLIKRSSWLRATSPAEPPLVLRPALTKLIDGVVTGHADVVGAVRGVMAQKGCYDFEIAHALERLLDHVILGGKDTAIVAVAAAAREAVPTLRIASYRARVLGAVIRAAAVVGDHAGVAGALDDVAEIAGDRALPATRELMMAVRPAIVALRRLDAHEAARRFLAAFVPVTQQTTRETAPLAAALAEGMLLIGEHDEAGALLQQALARTTSPTVSHVDRYEAGLAVVRALAHWPLNARTAVCEELLVGLKRFDDTFTTKVYYPTHQVLMAEALIDTLADEVTLRSDRVQAHLDQDEVRLRRRVIADWRAIAAPAR